ncbi:MAG TPA: chromosomal replication initiator protein DnaA [Nitrospinaceae bacterium]|nr:chromosomal replication initiator protein DnaA [Nitrospinaceae bacterium]
MTTLNANLWEKCRDKIRNDITEESYNTWFQPINFESITETKLVLSVPNTFYKDCLEQNYLDIINSTLNSFTQSSIQACFEIENNSFNHPKQETPKLKNEKKAHSLSFTAATINPNTASSTINPKYNFENFVVGSSNQFAHAAARSVADNPKVTYNPLFVYGGVGLGKTHLLHAMGNAILKTNPQTKVRYLSAESFTVDLIESLKQDDMRNFRSRYRPLDVLFVDDIQFLAGKERTQEEFFYTFNALHQMHKQVILSSDSYPKDLSRVEERLRSRFEAGLVADIEPPDLETKIAIIYKKAETHNKQIPSDVATFIATNIKTNVRELEGLLLRVIAYASFTRRFIDLELTKEVLAEFICDVNRNFNLPTIMAAVADHFEIKVSDIKSKKRTRNISVPRQIAMYLCRTKTKLSLPEIGRQFGGKDHTTVIFANKKISELLNKNNPLKKIVNIIVSDIESGKTIKNIVKRSE